MVSINYGKVRSDAGGGSTPIGTILPWSKATAPSGFLKCDGTAISRVTFADLFEVIGTTYGVGDGSTTFNLPDLSSRSPVGANSTTNIGQTSGTNQVTPTFTGNLGTSITGQSGESSMSIELMGPHRHTFFRSGGPGATDCAQSPGVGVGNQMTRNLIDNTGGGAVHCHNLDITANVTGQDQVAGQAVSTFQPGLVVIYIIKF